MNKFGCGTEQFSAAGPLAIQPREDIFTEPQFVQQWEGDSEASLKAGLEAMLDANDGDEFLCEWLRAAEVGQHLTTGGGAAPQCIVLRVA